MPFVSKQDIQHYKSLGEATIYGRIVIGQYDLDDLKACITFNKTYL